MNLPHPEPCDHHDASRDLAGQAPAISLFQWPGHAKGQVGSNTRHKPAPQCLPRSVVRRSCAISTATAIVYTRRLNCLYPKAQLFIPEGSIVYFFRLISAQSTRQFAQPHGNLRRSCDRRQPKSAICVAAAQFPRQRHFLYTRRLNCLYPKAQLFIPEGSILSLKTFAATPLPTLSTLSTCPLDASRR